MRRAVTAMQSASQFYAGSEVRKEKKSILLNPSLPPPQPGSAFDFPVRLPFEPLFFSKVTPEVLVDIAGKIPEEVKENLWVAIKSGNPQKMVVSKMPPRSIQKLKHPRGFHFILLLKKGKLQSKLDLEGEDCGWLF